MFEYKRRIAMQVWLLLLHYAIEGDAHAEVLDVLGRGIKAAKARIDSAASSGSNEYAEAITEAENEIIEGLLGAAYVVCQTWITAVTKAALRCRKRAIKEGLPFTASAKRVAKCAI